MKTKILLLSIVLANFLGSWNLSAQSTTTRLTNNTGSVIPPAQSLTELGDQAKDLTLANLSRNKIVTDDCKLKFEELKQKGLDSYNRCIVEFFQKHRNEFKIISQRQIQTTAPGATGDNPGNTEILAFINRAKETCAQTTLAAIRPRFEELKKQCIEDAELESGERFKSIESVQRNELPRELNLLPQKLAGKSGRSRDACYQKHSEAIREYVDSIKGCITESAKFPGSPIEVFLKLPPRERSKACEGTPPRTCKQEIVKKQYSWCLDYFTKHANRITQAIEKCRNQEVMCRESGKDIETSERRISDIKRKIQELENKLAVEYARIKSIQVKTSECDDPNSKSRKIREERTLERSGDSEIRFKARAAEDIKLMEDPTNLRAMPIDPSKDQKIKD